MVLETSEHFNILTRLIARENFIEFSRRANIKTDISLPRTDYVLDKFVRGSTLSGAFRSLAEFLFALTDICCRFVAIYIHAQ